MRAFNTWQGPADAYQRPGVSGQMDMGAHQINRWLPFKNKGFAYEIMAPGAKNASGTSWEQYHAGVRSEAISKNFRTS